MRPGKRIRGLMEILMPLNLMVLRKPTNLSVRVNYANRPIFEPSTSGTQSLGALQPETLIRRK
jgi:hypothetical protein